MKRKHLAREQQERPNALVPHGALTIDAVTALRAAGVRVHAVEPAFGPALGIWISGLFVTLDTTPPRPVVQCIRSASPTDATAEVRGRYVAQDDADAAAMFNACLTRWTGAFPVECTLRGQQAGCHHQARASVSRVARAPRQQERRAA